MIAYYPFKILIPNKAIVAPIYFGELHGRKADRRKESGASGKVKF